MASIPFSPHPPESYEARFNATVRQEISTNTAKIEAVRMNRLAAHNSALASPTGGTWAIGDQLLNAAPVEAGAGGSKYILLGWIYTAAGWFEMRTLTGN